MAKEKEKSFVWTDALTKTLLQMLSEYQRENGNNRFSWIQLTETFEQRTNLKCNKDTLKNKYNNMRVVWKLWTTLKHGEGELGWDCKKQCIVASAEWWARKLQENKEYRIFRRNGFSPEMESMMKFLFHETIATGSDCVAPKTTVPNSTLMHLSTPNDGEDSKNDLVDKIVGVEPTPVLGSDGVVIPTSCPLPPRVKGKKRLGNETSQGVERNIRKSVGSSLYHENLAASLKNNNATVEANSATHVASNQPKNVCTEAFKFIEGMVEEGFLVQGSALWCFSVSLIVNETQRMLFTLLPSNDARLSWIKWEFKKEGKMGLLPDH